jgi:peptide/nickel transport system substrate-binding protein
VAQAQPFPQMAYSALFLNSHDQNAANRPHPVLGELAVRRAISMGADRRAMLQNVWGKYGRLAYGPFARIAYTADTTISVPQYDTTAARALLDSAGWREKTPGGIREKNGRPLQFSILVPTSSLSRTQYAVLLQQQLRKVGMQVDIDRVDFPVFLERQDKGKFDGRSTR